MQISIFLVAPKGAFGASPKSLTGLAAVRVMGGLLVDATLTRGHWL